MGSFLSSRRQNQNDKEPEVGDLIEIFRKDPITYQHWAVYVGSGFVVHFVNTSGLPSSAPDEAANGTVLMEKFWDVVGQDKWKINNSLDGKYKPRPAKVIEADAKAKVGKKLRYDLTSYNCEHFVTELRYGVAKSQQVENAALGIAGVTALAGGLSVASMASNGK